MRSAEWEYRRRGTQYSSHTSYPSYQFPHPMKPKPHHHYVPGQS